jgi:hypothetical protein
LDWLQPLSADRTFFLLPLPWSFFAAALTIVCLLMGGGHYNNKGGLFAHLGYKAALALSAVLLLLAVVVAAFIRFPSPAADQPPEESDQRQVEVFDPLTTELSSDASNAA